MEVEARISQLEHALDRLAEVQARTEVAITRLAEAQARTEERVGRLEARMEAVEAALARLAEAQARTEERVGRLEARMEAVEAALVRLAEAQARTEERLERLEVQVQTLAEAQARTEMQVQTLAEAQARTEEQVARQSVQLQTLINWQQGETGRRAGERYERDTVRRASTLFNGGSGGVPDQPDVQRRLSRQLQAVLAEGILPTEADPSLADLLWWKGDRLAIVEISLQVNGEDVHRATQRARTLQRAGAQAVAVVIGEAWATLDARERARASGVEWKMGADLSAGFLTLRRLAAVHGEEAE
jgi:hypothetical protein